MVECAQLGFNTKIAYSDITNDLSDVQKLCTSCKIDLK